MRTASPLDEEGQPDPAWDREADELQAEAERRFGIEEDRTYNRHHDRIGF